MTTQADSSKENLSKSDQTWSIAEVERETGIGKDTLRVWERRYGFPVPGRDLLGERAYPEDQVQRLRLIKRLMDIGHRPGKIVALPMTQLAELSQSAPPKVSRTATVARGASVVSPTIEDADQWVEWLKQGRTDLIRQKLQGQILKKGLGHVVEEWIAPLCVFVGDAWLRGELSVYQEHLFTESVQSVMREAIAAVESIDQTQSQRRPRVLLTTTPNAQHGLGLLMAECHFALETCPRFVLGTSTPISEIVQAVQNLDIDVVALSFSAFASRQDVTQSLTQLRQQLPPHVEIWAGGSGVSGYKKTSVEGVAVMSRPSHVMHEITSWRTRHLPQA